MSVRHFTSKDAKFYQYADRQIFVGDVLDSSNSDTMSLHTNRCEPWWSGLE